MGHTSEFPFGIYWWTLKNLKNQNFEKMKKNCWRYHHFTHVYQKPQSYEVQLLRYEVRQSFLSFWTIFWPFNPLPPTNPKNQNFEGIKKEFGDVIILNLCNKKHDHMMYAYSDMECSHRHNFLSLQAIFCSFAQLLTQKIKVWKKCKKTPYIILLHMCTNNLDHMSLWYDAWFLTYEVQQTELFWIILKISKMERKPCIYHHFTQKYQKSWLSAILFERCGARLM